MMNESYPECVRRLKTENERLRGLIHDYERIVKTLQDAIEIAESIHKLELKYGSAPVRTRKARKPDLLDKGKGKGSAG